MYRKRKLWKISGRGKKQVRIVLINVLCWLLIWICVKRIPIRIRNSKKKSTFLSLEEKCLYKLLREISFLDQYVIIAKFFINQVGLFQGRIFLSPDSAKKIRIRRSELITIWAVTDEFLCKKTMTARPGDLARVVCSTPGQESLRIPVAGNW